jgi:hypothetical protein
VKCVSPIVHRVLMDMCCAVKDIQVVPGIENVSKTKIRGLFALLKACQGLGIMSEEGESVQLRLGDGINSFKDLKQRHDMFMSQILNHLRVVLPLEVKAQLLWNWNDPEYVARKVLEMKQLEEIVEDFFLSGKPVSFKNSNVLLTSSSPHNEEDERYNFEDDFGSTFTVQQDFLSQKQQQQFPNTPFNSHQMLRNQQNERNLSHSQFQPKFRLEPPERRPFPTRGPVQVKSIFQQTTNLSQQSQPRKYTQDYNNSKNNYQPFMGNNNSLGDSNSSSSQQLPSYWNDSQQILRSHHQVSRSNNSDNISSNLAYHINNNNNNSDNSEIPSYQSSSSMMNSYNANKNW